MSATVPTLGLGQVGWVVENLEAAEAFFTQTIGVRKFLRFENMRAGDVEGTYRGQPGDWVCRFSIGYAGDVQIEIVQHVSGSSVYADYLGDGGRSVQHVAYVLNEADYQSAAHRLESAGYAPLQTANTRIGKFGYFDTRGPIGVVTELIGLNDAGRALFQDLKSAG